MADFEDTKRVKTFRRELIAAIPRFPNDKTTRTALEAKSLSDLMIIHLGHRLRYVAQRPRGIIGRDRIANDPRAATLQLAIDAFCSLVEQGGDLTPYLSLLPHTKGWSPDAEGRKSGGDSWADKDFMLNVMGLHHFHLGPTIEAKGHAARTDELIFAAVSRDTFEIIGLFNHDTFNDDRDANGAMTAERERIWAAFDQRQCQGALPGALLMGGAGGLGVASSGRPLAIVLAAQNHRKFIRAMEPRLDDPEYLASTIYGAVPMDVPAKPKLRWRYNHLDFGLVDEAHSQFFTVSYGPN